MASMGQTVSKSLCEHFAYSREELYNIVKIKGYKTFNEVLHNHGEVRILGLCCLHEYRVSA
jgi:nitrite reductase (NADH) large subunit